PGRRGPLQSSLTRYRRSSDNPTPRTGLEPAVRSHRDVEDMANAVAETARVLEVGGRVAVCVTHPVADAGRFASSDADAPFIIASSYLGRRRFADVLERDGLSMDFSGWCYDLEHYFAAFESAKLLVERLIEPVPLP